MTRTIRTIAAAALAATMLGGPGGAWAQSWDMSYAWPEGNFHVQNGMRFAEGVAEVTDGRVTITVHPGGALGLKGPEAMAAVRDGLVPIAEYSFEQQNGEVPFASLGAMPGLAMGYDETATLLETMRPQMDEIFADYNQKLLYVVPWPGQAVYAKQPIESLADLEGYKLRAANARAVEFFEALGAAPILLPWAEVVPSLASGVIDGVSTSSSSGVDGQFWEFMSDMSRFDWANPLSVVTVNLDAWSDLSAEDQAAIEGLAAELEPRFWDVSRAEDERNLARLAEEGIAVAEPSDAMRAEIAAASEAIWEEFLAQAGPEAAEVVAAYREAVGK
jgi:TRAP-type C4-dicarboxylate transport system substrate-binding protein